MDFLDKFDKLPPVEANELLFEWMCERPIELCEQLRRDRPVLKFWSHRPGNPSIEPTPKPNFAYVLTGAQDVRYALEHFSMKSYSRNKNRYFLAEDQVDRHEHRRSVFTASLSAIDPALMDVWIQDAVEEAWDLQLDNMQQGTLHLDVAEFSREAALRFCGTLYGLPREEVVAGQFRNLTSTAFEHFIYKLFARHFEPPEVVGDAEYPKQVITALAGVAVRALQLSSPAKPETFTDFLIRNNTNRSTGQKTMNNRGLVSNLIGGFQGFIDNAVSCTCIALDEIVPGGGSVAKSGNTQQQSAYAEFQEAVASGEESEMISLMRSVQRRVPPAPWLPRVGNLHDLPSVKAGSRNFSLPTTPVACVLAMGSAMSQSYNSNEVSVRAEIEQSDPKRYQNSEDLRMGYGFHRCVGLELGDKLVARILLRIGTLNNISKTQKLEKQWSWIVRRFAISGTSTSDSLATRWTRTRDANTMVALCAPLQHEQSSGEGQSSVGAMRPFLTSDFKSIDPSVLARLSLKEIACLSTRQLSALTDRQLAVLTAEHIGALDTRLKALSCEQLVKLSTPALLGLTETQVKSFNAQQVQALSRVRAGDLGSGNAAKFLDKHASRHAIRDLTLKIPPRPHAFSLWSVSYDTEQAESYTCWPGLSDSAWTARHREPAKKEAVDELRSLGTFKSPESPGLITSMFKRAPNKEQKTCDHTSVLFSWFAQWVSDSFLRTNLADRRRNQSNHQIDLCQLYGLNEQTTRQLRSHQKGRLCSEYIDGQEYMPKLFDASGEIAQQFRSLPYVFDGSLRAQLDKLDDVEKRRPYIFAAALDRGNSGFGYVAISTLFLREHNRICGKLALQEPSWDDERLFQTARMILIVLLLKIVIEEYINHITSPGDESRRPYRFDNQFAELESWYRPPRITLEFNLLYRWHSLVPSHYVIGGKRIETSKYLMNNEPFVKRGLAELFADATRQPAGRPGLYNTEPALLRAEHQALRMSRNYRVASFNTYRAHFGLLAITDFRDLTEDTTIIDALSTNYEHPANIEFLVGLYAEEPQGGRLFGNLMTRMLGYDAFTQTLSNPLLARNVFKKETFTDYGIQLINNTQSLSDLVKRNGGSSMADNIISFDYKQP